MSTQPWRRIASVLSLVLMPEVQAVVFNFTEAPPPGLNAGAPYRIIYVTSARRDPAGIGIAVYNAFAQNDASASPALAQLTGTWKALASSQEVDARDNTATPPDAALQVPIYTTNGVRIADNYSDLWDGSIAAPIADRGGDAVGPDRRVWTGTNASGTEAFIDGDSHALFNHPPMTGSPAETDARWIALGPMNYGTNLSFYALSAPLHASIPEPRSVTTLAGVALLCMICWQRFGYGKARNRKN